MPRNRRRWLSSGMRRSQSQHRIVIHHMMLINMQILAMRWNVDGTWCSRASNGTHMRHQQINRKEKKSWKTIWKFTSCFQFSYIYENQKWFIFDINFYLFNFWKRGVKKCWCGYFNFSIVCFGCSIRFVFKKPSST